MQEATREYTASRYITSVLDYLQAETMGDKISALIRQRKLRRILRAMTGRYLNTRIWSLQF